MEEVMDIQEIKEKYKNEWVLVEVIEEDELQKAKKVKLISHAKTRDGIYKALKENKKYTYQFYTGEIPEKGFAVAFHG
jgi:hypothetical protein